MPARKSTKGKTKKKTNKGSKKASKKDSSSGKVWIISPETHRMVQKGKGTWAKLVKDGLITGKERGYIILEANQSAEVAHVPQTP